jgi:hypothetical protein
LTVPTIAGASLKNRKFKGLSGDGTRFALYADMRIGGPFESNARGGLKTLAAPLTPCQKSSDSSQLGQGKPNLDADRRKGQPTLRVQLVSQNNTVQPDPFWDGPRISPAFAAQLIGQTVPDSIGAHAASYGRAAPRMALLLDRMS